MVGCNSVEHLTSLQRHVSPLIPCPNKILIENKGKCFRLKKPISCVVILDAMAMYGSGAGIVASIVVQKALASWNSIMLLYFRASLQS